MRKLLNIKNIEKLVQDVNKAKERARIEDNSTRKEKKASKRKTSRNEKKEIVSGD